MYLKKPPSVQILARLLQQTNVNATFKIVRRYCTSEHISIGNVKKIIHQVKHPELVPRSYYDENVISQSALHHLQWMMQKDNLGQDIFLLGPPGPRRRQLAMQYLELTNQEHEYVALSRDTTESDLKQRREIVQGTAKYFDQSAVRAAIEGRTLVLEGIEKAERNVLPVLNNLLENREMHLEDGRMLIPSQRYDELLQQFGPEELHRWRLLRVDEKFRVIALGLPIPKYRGNPLDPPLRSRFQARDVSRDSYQEWYEIIENRLSNGTNVKKMEQILSCAFAILSTESTQMNLPDFPLDNISTALKLLENDPDLTAYEIFYKLYPYRLFLQEQIKHLELTLLKEFGLKSSSSSSRKNTHHNIKSSKDNTTPIIETSYQNQVLQEMLSIGKCGDFCVIGPKGCGKNVLIEQYAKSLNRPVENIVLYQDMTSRDLIQQRATTDNGDTIWYFTPLVNAALSGKIAVLDGIHRIHPSTFSILHRLVHDRELHLYNGKRLVSTQTFEFLKEFYKLNDEELTNQKGVLRVHPEFRIIAIGEPPAMDQHKSTNSNWLTPEMLSLFLFQDVRMLNRDEEMHIISTKFGSISESLRKMIDLAHLLRNNNDPTLRNLSGHLSTRQLLRIAARMANFPTDLYDTIDATFMMKYLPTVPREALKRTLIKLKIPTNKTDSTTMDIKCETKDNVLTIGQSSAPIYQTEHLTKVPNILFYDIPQHLELMERLLQDFQLGQHLLLVGNQGVGKNKIIDRFLQLLNRPREYIQLHRDTTVQTLTTQPTIRDGILVHEDSALVRAVKYGHVLVIDEADKAPTHVTCILKTLVESGEMTLSDGRRISRNNPQDFNTIIIHPDFRCCVLANRPGFPFLGNDFFSALGDLFSSHTVDNPAPNSEMELLRKYGPNVEDRIIKRLINVFGDLRNMADQGLVNYPYSTREVVNIVKHLNTYPESDLEEVILNVFDFDRYSPEIVDTLGEVLGRHGFSGRNAISTVYLAKKRAKEHLQVTTNRHSGLDANSPKHGKEDPKNEPHVGGNTWAGGTGGRDTAGLGGKGGPYRLDKGHSVHQLSDEEKNAVPQHVLNAAREMNRKAFAEKLREIGMSGYDASLYQQFYNSVERQIQSMRAILTNLQAKNKERYWVRHQTGGELDDVKLVDGLLGEKTIYRKRKEQEPELGAPQLKPKIFRIVADVSGSMYRFNGHDGRLDRELEAIVLVMEAFQGFDEKIHFDIIGHSGESRNIPFVNLKEPPKNNKERLTIIRTMYAHSQYCWSGDNTLEATKYAIESLSDIECDEAIVVVLSDANLQRYGIPASELTAALTCRPAIGAYAVFIGSLGNQAQILQRELPAGRAFICNDVSDLPQILKQIFSSSVLL